jgi:hypothetical protein
LLSGLIAPNARFLTIAPAKIDDDSLPDIQPSARRIEMKIRMIAMTVATCLIGLNLAYAESPLVGTWKLNEAKSRFGKGMSKSVTVVYTTVGDSLKCTIDGIDKDGKPTHTEWIGKSDGKDYPVTGDPSMDSRWLKMVNEHTYKIGVKKGGEIVYYGEILIAPDGDSRTVMLHGTNADGKKVSSSSAYDKQ